MLAGDFMLAWEPLGNINNFSIWRKTVSYTSTSSSATIYTIDQCSSILEMAVSDGKPYHFQLVVGEAVVVPTTTGFHTKSDHS